MRRALADYRIDGVITTIPFHQLALAHPAFVSGEATVNFIPRHLADQLQHLGADMHGAPSVAADVSAEPARTFDVEVSGRRFTVRVAERGVERSAPEEPRRP